MSKWCQKLWEPWGLWEYWENKCWNSLKMAVLRIMRHIKSSSGNEYDMMQENSGGCYEEKDSVITNFNIIS